MTELIDTITQDGAATLIALFVLIDLALVGAMLGFIVVREIKNFKKGA